MDFRERFVKLHSEEAWGSLMRVNINPAIRAGSFGDWDDSLANEGWDWDCELIEAETRGAEVEGTAERLESIRDSLRQTVPGVHRDELDAAMKAVSLAFAEVRALARAAA